MDYEILYSCLMCGATALEYFDYDCKVVKCQQCGLLFENPRPTLASIIDFYSRQDKYDNWLFKENARNNLWMRRLRKIRKHNAVGPILDIGAGVGQFLFYARDHFGIVNGTEVSASAINIAHEKYGLILIQGSFTAIDWGNRRFNTITMFHVLEHLHDPQETLRRCYELMEPGGLLVIAVPNELFGLKTKAKQLLKRVGIERFQAVGKLGMPKIALDGSVPEIHLVHYTPVTLKNALIRAGFGVIEVGLDPYYATTGVSKLIHTFYYGLASLVLTWFNHNLYDTIWAIAQKTNK